MLNLKLPALRDAINGNSSKIMFSIILVVIFFRPFICALAFPYLNLVYSLTLLIFLGAYLILKKPSWVKFPVLTYPFIFFYIALSLGVIRSQNQSGSLAQLYQYASGLSLFLIAANLSEQEKLLTIKTFILAGSVISLLAFYQYLFGFRHLLDYVATSKISVSFILEYLGRKRVFLPFVTPAALGGYLAMIVPLTLVSKNRVWLLLLILPALLLTKSPGAFLSLFLALIIYFVAQGKLKKNNILLLAGFLLLIVISVITRSVAAKEHLHPGFSAMMRLNYWRQSWVIIQAHPLTGVGLGNFNLAQSRYAHNSFLQIWAEMGIIGIASWLWLIAAAFKVSFKRLSQAGDKRQISGLIAASAVFLIHNFLDFTFFLPEISLIWWVILGLTLL